MASKSQRLRSCTSRAAFTVQVRLKKDEPAIGPGGLVTKIRTVLSAEGGRGWLFPIAEAARHRLVTFVFWEKDRQEVVRRFMEIGIDVPSKPQQEGR